MAHGVNTMLKRGANHLGCKNDGKPGVGSRRIFAPQFKLQVLDSYRNDADCKGNQRATARKYGIHRRQIQKWLQVENNLRNSVIKSGSSELIANPEARNCGVDLALRNSEHRQLDDVSSEAYARTQPEAELERVTAPRIGEAEVRDTAADRRVPDIPPQHSPAAPFTLESGTQQWCAPAAHRVYPELDYAVSTSSSAPSLSPPRIAPYAPTLSPPLSTLPYRCDSPEAPLLPLDFTTHSRHAASASPPLPHLPIPVDTHATPMDLSLKKQPPFTSEEYMPVVSNNVPLVADVKQAHACVPEPDPLIWDLSIKTIKREEELYSKPSPTPSESPAKQPKLFKPYLDHIDDCGDESSATTDGAGAGAGTPDNNYGLSMNSMYTDAEPYTFTNNNTVFKVDYTCYKDDSFHFSTSNYYCPVNGDYYPGNPSIQHYVGHYDDVRNPFIFHKNASLIKQRQSYSLDFKLSAIECYYSDAVCRGNQRAVASKFKIHRRQVQKWLKQENQLRQRNETVKPMYIIR